MKRAQRDQLAAIQCQVQGELPTVNVAQLTKMCGTPQHVVYYHVSRLFPNAERYLLTPSDARQVVSYIRNIYRGPYKPHPNRSRALRQRWKRNRTESEPSDT